MGGHYVVVGRCHDGVGGVEGNAGVSLEEGIFFPKEGKAVFWDGWKIGGVDGVDGMVKGMGNEADVNGFKG